jgi:alpha-tubulin suppressor-like RCC1 family protein
MSGIHQAVISMFIPGITGTIAYAWGDNSQGRLGDGTTTSRTSPVTVIGDITNWAQVAAGSRHSVGITSAGIAYAWGNNSNGRLGDGTGTNRNSPVTVIGGITNWAQVSGGANHSLGITDTGIAYAWGGNSSYAAGALGDGTTTSRSSPVTVIGGITDWAQVSTTGFHSLGVTDTGIAYAWGNNNNGRLGDGTTVTRSSPVTVIGGITNWAQVSAGGIHSLGVTATGIAYAWGSNQTPEFLGGDFTGQLGDGTTINRSSPVTVIGGITNWAQVAAGRSHSLGVTASGIAYAWGYNGAGQLGDGTSTARSSPVTVIGGITNWTQVAGGYGHSLGVTETGIAYAWGFNSDGRLGDDTTTGRSSPVTVVGGITSWTQVSGGGSHSLGLRKTKLL